MVVDDGDGLTEAVKTLMLDKLAAEKLAANGRAVIVANRGATERSIEAIVGLLGYQMPHGEGGIATQAVKATE